MSRGTTSNQPIQVSILDRLLDDEPDRQQDAPQTHSQMLRDLKQAVRRDLENLLNTRWRCVAWPPDLGELETSLVNYGIPDFCGGNIGADNPDTLLEIIQFTIRHFEPRLKNVRVSRPDKSERVDRTLPFRIDAVLCVDPIEDRVAFDSALEINTGNVRVEGGNR